MSSEAQPGSSRSAGKATEIGTAARGSVGSTGRGDRTRGNTLHGGLGPVSAVRRPGRGRRWLAAAAVAGTVTASLASGPVAADEGDPTPTQAEVRDAQQAADGKRRDVAAVRAELVVANADLEDAAVEAEKASEAYNGARWEAKQARREARRAARAADGASQDVTDQRASYGELLVEDFQSGPDLSGLAAVTESDGLAQLQSELADAENRDQAMDGQYDELRADEVTAEVAAIDAEQASQRAEDARVEARRTRDAAHRAELDAQAVAADVQERKGDLIAELATLQGISTDLAERRQAALEQQAAEEAAAEAEEAVVGKPMAPEAGDSEEDESGEADDADQPSEDAAPTQSPTGVPTDEPTDEPTDVPADEPTGEPTTDPTDEPTTDPVADPEPTQEPTQEPTEEPTQEPTQEPTEEPAPSAGSADAAIAFARAQLGEPYQWGAAGPGSWDCSGLTMGAWASGGKSLPHYSAAQYTESTKITVDQLQPGDLVFWGSSSSPSSIYHVALYVGDGKIIHAPRTGRPVTEESMYYWIPPTFFARP